MYYRNEFTKLQQIVLPSQPFQIFNLVQKSEPVSFFYQKQIQDKPF